MTAQFSLPDFANLVPNPNWASLPMFDRSGWKRVRFGDFAQSVNERVEPADAAEEIYVGLDDLDSRSLHIRRWGKGSDVTGTKLRFQKGDIIFGRRRAYQRKVAVAKFDGICSAHAMVVRAKLEMVLPEFLPFLMMSDRFMNRAIEISVGSLSPTINWTSLKLEMFELPLLDQQRRIVEVLWAIDKANESNLAQVIHLQQYRRAAWTAHKSECETKTVRIGDVAVVANGSTPSKLENRYWIAGTHPWLPTGKVHERFIVSADEFITKAALTERKARVFPKGSVLVAMIGQGKTRGSVALMEIDASVNQNFACIVPRDVGSHYLFYALDYSYEQLRRSSHGSNQEALNCSLVADFPIPFASPRCQEKITTIMLRCEEAQQSLQSCSSAYAKLLSEVVNSIF